MSRPILVSYASKHGSTAEVAEVIAASLVERGLEVDVRPAGEVDDTARYGGVVLGAALYTGHVHRDARRFLRRHQAELSTLPVAVFAMGPQTRDATAIASSRSQLDHALRQVPEVAPFSVAVFGGVVDPTELGFPFNRMSASDARDWDAIHRWADELGARFGDVDRHVSGVLPATAVGVS